METAVRTPERTRGERKSIGAGLSMARSGQGDLAVRTMRRAEPVVYLQLTRELDPDGRWVMTTARFASLGAGALELVDASRLGRVAVWSPQWLDGASGAEAAALVAPEEPLVRFTSEQVGLTASTDVDGRRRTPTDADGATVVLGVRSASGPATLRLGPFPAGTTTLTGDSTLCAGGCTLVSISLENSTGTVRVRDLTAEDVAVSPDLASPGWTTQPDLDSSSPTTPVTTVDGTLPVESGELLVPPLMTRPLPVIAGVDASDLLGEEGATVLEVPSDVLAIEVVGRSESLPSVGPAGVLLDLSTFLARYDPPPPLVTTTVLVRADTPPSVVDGLIAAGLSRSTGVAETRQLLDDSAYAQALRLYLVVAAALLVMALGGLLVSSAVQLPARRRDAASLRVVCVRRSTMLLASLWESAVVLGAAALAGLVAGGLALAVLLPSLRLGVVDADVTPRVLPDPDLTRLAVLSVGVTAVLVLVAVATSVAVLRRAHASILRETVR